METTEKKIAAVETKWALDPSHSEIAFKVKHMMIANVKGLFKEFEINVTSNGVDFSDARIDFQMKAASIETGDANRDGHLKSADFFDVENFPLITFKSNSLVNINDEIYVLDGDLTIRGVTKPVKLDVDFGGVLNDPWGNTKAGFTLNGKISRKEFGLVWNAALESGGVLVGDDVKITCEVELAKQA